MDSPKVPQWLEEELFHFQDRMLADNEARSNAELLAETAQAINQRFEAANGKADQREFEDGESEAWKDGANHHRVEAAQRWYNQPDQEEGK